MSSYPFISVLMPVYNAELYIKESIESVLSQSFTNFEFIIIDDGSEDNSHCIISSYKDSRICYIRNEKNLGLIETLNKGISLTVGKYIARIDADDIAMPDRFKKQIEFLEKEPEYGVVGTNAKAIDSSGKYIQDIIYPELNDTIKKNMIVLCPFGHFSVMIRKELLVKNDIRYREKFKHAEDYALWVEMSTMTKFFNIQDFLMLYRTHSTSVSIKFREVQQENRNRIRESYIHSVLNEDNLLKEFYLLSYKERVVQILKYKQKYNHKYTLYESDLLQLMYLDGLELVSKKGISVIWNYLRLSKDKRVSYLLKEYIKSWF